VEGVAPGADSGGGCNVRRGMQDSLNMDLEGLLAKANTSVALREFTFSGNQFAPSPGDTKQFADGVLWLKKRMIVYQVKERATGRSRTLSAVEKWFAKKVRDQATSQIRDTHEYLRNNTEIVLTNARGHGYNVNTGAFEAVLNVVLYGSDDDFPRDWRRRKYHVSRSSGTDLFIHLLEFSDYLLLSEALLTPMEVFEYLAFRSRYLSEVDSGSERAEKWLLGRFLMSSETHQPSLDDSVADLSAAVDNLRNDRDLLSARKFLEGMGDRVTHVERLGATASKEVVEDTMYYGVLIAFALLNRTALKLWGERMSLALDHAKKDELQFFRFEVPELQCGYLVAALPRELRSIRRGFLVRYLQLSKYERKLNACAGVSVCFDSSHIDIDWAWVEEPWAQDDALDKILSEKGSPFRPLKEGKVLLYDTRI